MATSTVPTRRSLLLVGGDPTIHELLHRILTEEGFPVTGVATLAPAPRWRSLRPRPSFLQHLLQGHPARCLRLVRERPALVPAVLNKEDHECLTLPEALVAAKRAGIPAVLLSTNQTVLDWIGAAVPCYPLCMPFDLDELPVTVERAMGRVSPLPIDSVVPHQAWVRIVPEVAAQGFAAGGGDQ